LGINSTNYEWKGQYNNVVCAYIINKELILKEFYYYSLRMIYLFLKV